MPYPAHSVPYRPPAQAQRRAVRMVPARRLNDLTTLSTVIVLAGLLVAGVAILYAETANQAFAYPAPFVGAALAIAATVEARAGLRNLVRVDLFMLGVLYLLTFFEFLLPQDPVPPLVTLEAAQTAVQATLLGFAGIVLGRHVFPARRPLPSEVHFRVSPRVTIWLLLGCAFFGYLYMLLAVRFDIFEMIYQMSRPRFSQPWTRGRLGGFSTLLNEVGLLTYLLPPLAASVFAQGRRYTLVQRAIAASIVGLVFYEGFAGGTRNVFLTHLITFTVTYALLMPRLTLWRLLALAVPLFAVAGFAVYYLPEIRTVGLGNFELETARTDSLFVDLNLINIAILTQAFPNQVGYLGFEIPFTAAVRPIPRALWPGKPEGLSVSIEEVIGVSGMTLSATFVGELWMAGGFPAIAIMALALGAAAARWNRIGAVATTNMTLILFASGFFPAGIAMRSFLGVGPTLLPLIALNLLTRIVGPRSSK
ncbi:hypothetical protein [Roseitranquillus sediminis]|uniref:hypothetical protein n=1 Tax=Roseitranquillus sediminis TaxID=2809051 RepID=UPI001D0CD844|nr:hypothetical protein [Roseitranquillus sediminis]MBM9594016.1 hypothetical protein [Roseitranquillus sediminis]